MYILKTRGRQLFHKMGLNGAKISYLINVDYYCNMNIYIVYSFNEILSCQIMDFCKLRPEKEGWLPTNQWQNWTKIKVIFRCILLMKYNPVLHLVKAIYPVLLSLHWTFSFVFGSYFLLVGLAGDDLCRHVWALSQIHNFWQGQPSACAASSHVHSSLQHQIF